MKKLTVKSLCVLIIAVMLLSGCGKTENSGNMPLEDKDESVTGLEYGMSFYEPAVNMSFAVDGAPAMPEVEPYFPEFNTEEYSYQKENSFISVLSNPFSTFDRF